MDKMKRGKYISNHLLAAAISVLSFFTALFYNELNLKHLRSEAPQLLEPRFEWIKTADDASYLHPAENYFRHGFWIKRNADWQSSVFRTPGYGLFRLALMKPFGLEQSHHLFRYFQLFLFAISVYLLFSICLFAGLNSSLALLVQSLYGLSPFAAGFLYYSITESITPALIILYTFLLVKGYQQRRPSYFIYTSVVLGAIGIIRPVLLVFGLALPAAVFLSVDIPNFRKMFLAVVTAITALAPLVMWAVKVFSVTGYNAGIYSVYFPQNNSQFRPTHQAIWNFQKSYGKEGKDFNSEMSLLWEQTMKGDNDEKYVRAIIDNTPEFVKESAGEKNLNDAYHLYRSSIIYQKQNYPDSVGMPDTIPGIEQEVISRFNNFSKKLNSEHRFYCNVIAPLKLFKVLSFHSNLSLYIFQHTYRGKWWMEVTRFFFLALHFLCCCSFIAALFLFKDKVHRLLFGLTVGVYIFYLCYFFRGLEERYTLPVLPLMLVALTCYANRLLGADKEKQINPP